MTLPFLDSEDDIHINLCIVLIIINTLGKTSRGTLKVNNGRLHIFLYLVKNPTILNQILGLLGKGSLLLRDRDAFSITSISPNIDPLFDREALKSLLSILIAKKLVTVVYKKNDGFFYVLNEIATKVITELRDEYFLEISLLCDKLKGVLNISEPQLNQYLNQIFRKESI